MCDAIASVALCLFLCSFRNKNNNKICYDLPELSVPQKSACIFFYIFIYYTKLFHLVRNTHFDLKLSSIPFRVLFCSVFMAISPSALLCVFCRQLLLHINSNVCKNNGSTAPSEDECEVRKNGVERAEQAIQNRSHMRGKSEPHQFGWLNSRLNVCVCCFQHDNTIRNVIYTEYYVCSRRFAIHCHAINVFVRNSHHLIFENVKIRKRCLDDDDDGL